MDVGTRSAWPGDAHVLLLGAGSFVALMVAGLITSARGSLVLGKVDCEGLKNVYGDMADWACCRSQD